MLPGGTELLERCFTTDKLLIIGIQEGRAPVADIRMGENYVMYIGASAKGHRGVQLWLNHKRPYAKQKRSRVLLRSR
jgi:hypothetical protein